MTGAAEIVAYFAALEHPFKSEMLALRAIILDANPAMAERIKWNVPSFYHRDTKKDFAAFHPRNREHAHLVIVFHGGTMIEVQDLLEGDYKDRRMAYFHDMADVESKTPGLVAVVNEWVALVEALP